MVALKATFVALSLFSLVQAVPRPLGRRTDSYSGGSSGGSYGGSSGGSSGSSYGGSSGGSYGGSSGGSYGGSSGSSYGGSSGGSSGGSYGGSSGGSYGGSSGGSYGGSSGGSYGGSSGGNSGYNGGSSSSSSSSMMMESSSSSMMMESSTMSSMSSMSTPPPMMQESSSMMMSSSSTMMMESSSSIPPPPPAETASSYMSMPSYGSGSSNWGNNGYDNCVQQCMASYAPPSSMYTQPPMPNGYDTSAKGSSGKVYTVIVAPKQGVLRFVPFSVQAQPGDTIRFRWGAGPHTVTKSSELEVCNATSSQPFASGKQNVGFTFDQVVNDTNPVYFYCGVQPHCEKGMFGILNPPSVDNNAPMSVGAMLNSTTDPALMAKIAMVTKAVANSTAAANWGGKFDMSKIPAASQSAFLDNVLLTRVTIAENTDQFDGQNFNPSNAFNLPDGYLAMDAATDSTNNAAAASSSGGAPASSGSSTAASAAQTSKKAAASRSVATSSGAVVAAVVAAAFFSL